VISYCFLETSYSLAQNQGVSKRVALHGGTIGGWPCFG
jgi:hypothetical protein